ncbi:MAG: MBOAT family protein, partial [Lachnospiraceae bacterium]|nr:MBOAT family protein [Lachnospiraceae bacterium]
VDVYWKKIPAQKNPLKLLLFLLFFPTIIEGPIAAYADVGGSIYAGNDLDAQQVMKGFLRIGWGVMKKLVIADRLFPAVTVLYEIQRDPHGAEVVAAAVLFTVMEYLDFSGCIDMALGYAAVFGIRLPENFKRPFLAKNASEFWRRWHISLGVWFKTYIFYPMSMSPLAKKWGKFAKGKCTPHLTKMVASAMALLPVWLCNGLWHGPKWTYIFYGIFYFVVIMAELILEPAGDKLLGFLHLEKDNRIVTVFRVLRTWFVIFLGELFFRANSLKDAFVMLSNVPRDFHIRMLWDGEALHWGLDKADWLIVGVGFLCVIIVNILREKGRDILQELVSGPIVLRWVLASALIFVIVMFGLYGPGYTEVDMIYAGF